MEEQREQLHKIRITHTVLKITVRMLGFFSLFNEYEGFENNFQKEEEKKASKVYLRPP